MFGPVNLWLKKATL